LTKPAELEPHSDTAFSTLTVWKSLSSVGGTSGLSLMTSAVELSGELSDLLCSL